MEKSIHRSLILSTIIGLLFVSGETFLRMFLSPNSTVGDLPMYIYNTDMNFFTLMGYSSVWMFLIAAIFSIVLGALNTKNDKNPWIKMKYRFQVLFGFVFIIILELLSGILLNKILGLSVWSYENFNPNFLGQIALIPSIMWLLLTPIIYFVDDLIRYYIFGEQHPDKFITYYTDIIDLKK